jgi:two-component system, OmpR family, sensor histidine kinase TctE
MRGEPPLLRRQLLGCLLIPLSLLLTTDAFVSYWIALKFSQRAYDRALVEIARDVSLHLRHHNGLLTLDLPETARRLLFGDPVDRIDFEIASAAGQHVEGATIAPPDLIAPDDLQAQTLYDGELNGAPVRIVQLAVGFPALVRIAETKHKRIELAREILASVVLPQVLLVLIAGVLVWVGVVRGLAPLEHVRRAVTSRSPRDWSPVVVAGVPGEVRPLLTSINELLASLDAALTVQSRFISDAAHQLKTPVAVLETQLELAMRERDEMQRRLALEKVQAGLTRLSRVTNQILSLARNEPEAVRSVALAPLDLNALALDICSQWVPEALKKQIDLGFEGSETPVPIAADSTRLRELCDNLIDNAIRYSREGGRVTVRVAGHPEPNLAVSDDSPSIPLQDRERVFERFHRLLGNTAEGSGLGLAIVKEIAHLHGAEVRLQDDEDGTGHTFSVTFPRISMTRTGV